MPKQKHHLKLGVKRLGVKGLGAKGLDLCPDLPIHTKITSHWIWSHWACFLLCEMKQMNKTAKSPFQLYLRNCIILEAISKLFVLGRLKLITSRFTQCYRGQKVVSLMVPRLTMVKCSTGNTYTLLKHRGSALMGGFTIKLIQFFFGNVGGNGIYRENGQNEENYSCYYWAALIQAPQYRENQVQQILY